MYHATMAQGQGWDVDIRIGLLNDEIGTSYGVVADFGLGVDSQIIDLEDMERGQGVLGSDDIRLFGGTINHVYGGGDRRNQP